MATFFRSAAFTSMIALAVVACGNAKGDDASAPTPATAATASDLIGHAKGSETAPLTVIEYASPTCSHCKHFYDDVMPTVEEKFIATGKVRFIFREFPLNDVDVIGYSIANCAGEDKFFDVLDDLFAHQEDVFASSKDGALKKLFLEIAARHGIADETALDACIADRTIRQTIADTMLSGEEFGVRATPTFIVNGKVKPADVDVSTGEAFEAYLNGQLENISK
ncbi:DsbA family protein [Hyphomonas johnsonii]|jgi:protein-disulfide isomerase|uniref:DSBA-like thioredoxin domain-containing protein n=1 Tax=Hyphomonas johnsonii MHS-2 TaxID=1280950 RepID=A0A059FRL6_9PROT|nr:thioredoxin domain-containing protein [Hyphomonas johnsonii]KCZ93320.1 DSBA-like thioredoxin domain-containing protein [Hyphomonas johnsonii MHS-2]